MAQRIRFISKKNYFLKKTLVWLSIFMFTFTQVHLSVFAEDEQPAVESPIEEVVPSAVEEPVVEAEAPSEETPSEQPSLPAADEPLVESTPSEASSQPSLPEEEPSIAEEAPEVQTGVAWDQPALPEEVSTSTTTYSPMTILENQFTIHWTTVEALFTRDGDNELREIELQQEAVFSGAEGIIITIPENTRILAPAPVEPMILESAFELPLEEEIIRVIEQVQSGVTTITSIETDSAEEDIILLPEEELVERVTEDIQDEVTTITSIETDIVEEEEVITQPEDDSLEGQLPLISDDITLETIPQELETLSVDSNPQRVFAFGLSGQHIIFTKPVEIRVSFPGVTNDTEVLLRVKHAGDDDFGTQGLSSNPDATCDELGNISSPWDIARVQNGEAVFYTCGASEFSIGVVHILFTPHFNNTVKALARLSNDNIVVGGLFTTWGANVLRNRMAMVTSTGIIDTVFNPNFNGAVSAFAVDTGDNIVVGGAFTTWGANILRRRVARVTSTGALDTTFTGNMNNDVNAVALQSNGAIIVGGAFTTWGFANSPVLRIARLTVTWTVDTSFTGNINNIVNTLSVQADDMVVVGGAFTAVNGVTRNRLARVTSTGALDTSFTGNVGNNFVFATAIQPDGNILIGGSFTLVNGVTRNRLARVTSTGVLDTTFTGNLNGTVSWIQLLPDGRILIAGWFTTVNGVSRTYMAVLTSTGLLDTSFYPTLNAGVHTIITDRLSQSAYAGGAFTLADGFTQIRFLRIGLIPLSACDIVPSSLGIWLLDTIFNPDANGTVNALWLQSDGCLVVGGAFTTVNGVARNRIARVTSTGALDTIFDPNLNGAVNAIAIDSEDNIFVGGAFTTWGANFGLNTLARITSTGRIDTTFIGETNGIVHALAFDSAWMLMVGGTFGRLNGVTPSHLGRLTSTGLRDMTFVGALNGWVYAIAPQPDGKLIVGGAFTTADLNPVNYITRLTTTGGIDTDFIGDANDVVYALALQPDGQVIVGGAFTTVQWIARNYIARLSTTGALDTTFDPNVNGAVTGIKLLPDGRILIAGWFTTVGGAAQEYMALLQSDGTLDTTFTLTGNAPVNTFAIDSTRAAYAGGAFTEISNTPRGGTAKIGLTDSVPCWPVSTGNIGVYDPVFDPNMNNSVNALGVQSNGCIIIGGRFTTGGPANIPVGRLARATTTGLIDPTFNPNFNGEIFAVAVDVDDSIIVWGAFTTGWANTIQNRVARVTSTGLIDLSFVGNPNNQINAIVIQPDGNILLGGAFTTINGVSKTRLARVRNNGIIDASFNGNPNGTVSAIAIQPDGNILVGGAFATVDGVTRARIARLTTTGGVDTTFTGNIVGGNVTAIAIQPDGNIVIGGTFTGVNGVARNRLARVTSTGVLDTTFNPDLIGSSVWSLKLLPDGRIFVGGTFTEVGGYWNSNVALLNTDGSSDISFETSASSTVSALAFDSTVSSVYLGGAFVHIDGFARNRVARVTLATPSICEISYPLSIGLLDATFDPDANGTVNALWLQSEGCVIVGGAFTTVGGVTRNRIARVTSTGALDTTFDPNLNGPVNAIVIDTGNNMIVGGEFTSWGANIVRQRLARITSTGLIDLLFTGNTNNTVNALALQPDGLIIAGGLFTNVNGVTSKRVARITSTGSADSTFSADVNGGGVNTLALQPDGNIVIGWAFTTVGWVWDSYISRITSTGERDSSFSGVVNNVVNTLVLQPDGKIIIGGAFTTVQWIARNYIARLSTTGLLDTTFNPNVNGIVTGIHLLPDGKILIGGWFTTVGGTAQQYMALLQSDGTLDTTSTATGNASVNAFAFDGSWAVYVGGAFTAMNNGTTRNRLGKIGLMNFTSCGTDSSSAAVGVTDAVFDPNFLGSTTVLWMGVQSDGCIIAVGTFTTWGNNIARRRIARLTVTWAIDMSYDPNINSTINAVAVQPDGKAIIGGLFTTGWANVIVSRLARLTSTGTIDTTFTGNVNSTVSAIIIQPDGKIVIGGAFTTVNGATRNRIARVKSNGFVDLTFTGNVNGTVHSIRWQPDGKILIGGAFTLVNGVTSKRVARVTSTGLLDTSFTGNVNNLVNAIAVQPDGNIIIGGTFTGVNGLPISRIARVTSTGVLDTTFNAFVTGTSADVSTIRILPDGRIVIAGTFTLVNWFWRNNLAVLLPDGSVDTTFDIPVVGAVSALALNASSSSVYIGGAFTTVDGVLKGRAAKIGLTPSTCVGLNGCILRLKADAGLQLSGDSAVSGWISQGLQSLTGVQSTGAWQPTYVTGAMNENPVVRFDGLNHGLIVENKFLDADTTQFVVFRSQAISGTITTNSATAGFSSTVCGKAFNLSGWKISTVLSWVRLDSTVDVNDNIPKLVSWNYGTGELQTLSLQGTVNATNSIWRPSVTGDNAMLIGRAGIWCHSGSALNGDIAEIVTFHRNLSAPERAGVESYLGIKYGITLDQTVATDYVLQGGVTPWDSFVAGVYDNDIAGIGRDDTTALNQLKSQSVNDTADISVQFTGTFSDDQFLMRWNDGGVNTGWTTTDSPADYYRLEREWFFQENYGDMGQTVIRIATWAIPIGMSVDDALLMFVDGDGTFAAGAVLYTGTLNGGYREFTANIADTEYITFAYYQVAPLGAVSISAPAALPYTGLIIPAYGVQTIQQHFNSGAEMYFAVDDGIGADPGYYTTLQLSGNLTTGAYSISATNVAYKVSSTGVNLLSGTANPKVVVDDASINYQHLGSPRTFILRDPAANGGVIGNYGAFIWIQTTIPAMQAAGSYEGTLVYTIIEN